MAFNCKTIIQYCFNIHQFKTTLWFLVNTDLTKNQILKARASKGKQKLLVAAVQKLYDSFVNEPQLTGGTNRPNGI